MVNHPFCLGSDRTGSVATFHAIVYHMVKHYKILLNLNLKRLNGISPAKFVSSISIVLGPLECREM